MSDKINKEIEELAENMEKSVLTPRERLLNTISELGPEGLRAKMSTLEKSEKLLLIEALEEIKKSKAVEMDDAYAATYVRGNINDTVIQEDKVDDDADEKLVKPEAAEHNHQGDCSPEGRDGHVIKSELEDLDDEDLDALEKSFGTDYDVMDDFLYSEDEDFQDYLLEKAKTATRGGIRYYTDGPNAGKKVGSVRGDKASINSIARARAKGKISAAGAKRGISDANATKKYADKRKKSGLAGESGSGKSDAEIKESARKKAVDRSVGFDSKKVKDKVKKLNDSAKPGIDARNKARKKLSEAKDKKKDGSDKKTKRNEKISEKIKNINARGNSQGMDRAQKYDKEIRKPTFAAMKQKDQELKTKRENMNKSEDLIEMIKKSDEMMYSMVKKMCGMSKSKDEIVDKCMAKGLDKDKISTMVDQAMKEHESKMHKSENLETPDTLVQSRKAAETNMDDMNKGDMKAMLPEEDQVKDGLDKLQSESTRANKEKVEALETDEDSKKAQDDVDSMKVKKSIPWNSENALIKAKTLGRNHHFSVNDYYDNLLADKTETVEKSVKEDKREDINDLIEKSLDCSSDEVLTKSLLEKNKEEINGKVVKSYSSKDIADALNLTEEEAKELLGE